MIYPRRTLVCNRARSRALLQSAVLINTTINAGNINKNGRQIDRTVPRSPPSRKLYFTLPAERIERVINFD